MNILGIETSCDETACAIVQDGRRVLSSVVYTQIPLHQPWGGVVPEVASRAHVEKISGIVREAMGCGEPIDAVRFLFSASGRNPVDASKCASGGELSRMMLSLKSLLASLLSWQTRFNVTIIFTSKGNTGALIHGILYYAVREHLLYG